MDHRPRACIFGFGALCMSLPLFGEEKGGALRADLMEQPGIVSTEFLYTEASFPRCHASTIAETPAGLVVAFFGGSGEGDEDVGIWVSRKPRRSERWTPPVEAANGVVSSEERHPCWNPVLSRFDDGPLFLFYKVGPSPSSWWGMRLVSRDDGESWSEAERLPEGIIGPVRAKPVLLPDGALLCGSSTEHRGWRVHMERMEGMGKTWWRTPPLNDGKDFPAIQPTILRYPGGKLQILCRSNDNLRESWSMDGGRTWGPLERSVLPNPSAGIDAVTMRDGRQLLVYNHSTRRTGARQHLNVAVSEDGKTWRAAVKLEDRTTLGGERAYGAYPGAIQTKDGLIHIVYTWKRLRINHVVLDPEKLVLRDMPGGAWPD